jgi:SAM-dependent methyltransferase
MSIEEQLGADLVLDGSGVWRLRGHERFAYSDGSESEAYLGSVLARAKDLGSDSAELESAIRDWPSEYHLSPARSRLLSGFRFRRDARVLEVGSGCGAITRFLGETFDSVVAVEGSPSRAALARMRTRDLPGVTVVCAPFHDLRPQIAFDYIFCVGVLEYSSSFVAGADPHDVVLRRFAEWLAPAG